MPQFTAPFLFALLFLAFARSASGSEERQPGDQSAFDLETGLLWEIGHSTPLAYRLVPTQLSWRSAKFFAHEFEGGSQLLLRHRLTLLGTWVQAGPESHYVGLAGSPSIEWWNRRGNWSLFTGAGGGFGVIDSRGAVGGQGQDFTLNWFARAGVEHVTRRHAHLTTGLMFQHMSNGGRTNPNPGIDAFGFTVGYGWSF
jgi:hypothetical protein